MQKWLIFKLYLKRDEKYNIKQQEIQIKKQDFKQIKTE